MSGGAKQWFNFELKVGEHLLLILQMICVGDRKGKRKFMLWNFETYYGQSPIIEIQKANHVDCLKNVWIKWTITQQLTYHNSMNKHCITHAVGQCHKSWRKAKSLKWLPSRNHFWELHQCFNAKYLPVPWERKAMYMQGPGWGGIFWKVLPSVTY